MSGVIMYSIHHCWMLMIFHCWLSIWNRYPSSKFAMPLSARDAKRNCLLAVLHVSKLEHLLCFNGSVCRMNHMITLLYVFLFLFYLKKRSGGNNYFVACGDHWSRSLTTQVVSMFWLTMGKTNDWPQLTFQRGVFVWSGFGCLCSHSVADVVRGGLSRHRAEALRRRGWPLGTGSPDADRDIWSRILIQCQMMLR
jgi:hypothetical protein